MRMNSLILALIEWLYMYYENKEVKAFLLLTTSDTAKEMLVLLIVLVKLTLKCYNLYVYWEVGKHITEFFFI